MTLLRRLACAAIAFSRSSYHALVCSGLLVTGGCFTARHTSTTHIEHGERINPGYVGQIVIGQTTRSDLFKWLGPPHSIFKDEAELVTYENVGFYSYAKNRQLTTFDEGHYALLYRFEVADTRSAIKIRAVPFRWNSEADNQAMFTGDELLIFLDRNTHVVLDVASRNRAHRK